MHNLRGVGKGVSLLAALSALLAGPIRPVASTIQSDEAPSIESWWHAEGDANDSIGGNNGVLEGGTAFAPGRVGMAFKFNGVDADVKVKASERINVGAGKGMTIAAWIAPSNVSEQPLVEWNDNQGSLGAHFCISVDGGPGSLFANLVDTNGGFHILYSKPGIITAGAFQHVALTYDKSTGNAALYANGESVATANLGAFKPQTSYDLYFANRPSGLAPIVRYSGEMDEIRLFSRALSAQEIRDLASKNLTLRGRLQSIISEIQNIPSRIRLRPERASAMPGRQITIQVSVMNNVDTPVPADRDYHIAVKASGGEVTPKEVTIYRGQSTATASVRSSTAGQVRVRASSSGLEEANRQVYYCGVGQIRGLDFNAAQQRALANGETIPLTVVLTDGNGHPVTDNAPKDIAFDFQGVGQLEPKAGYVPPDQCARDESAFSFEPGKATIRASLGNLGQDRKLVFILPLSFTLFMLIMCGGAGGAFIRAAVIWPKSRRWSRSRWMIFLASGALVGLCVFLAYYYGFLKFAPQFMGGQGVGLLLGLIGGYLGQVAMDRISDRILPATGSK